MARAAKSENNIQVFRGSKPRADVFAQNAGSGCCGTGVDMLYDKLGERTRFDNGLSHLSPDSGRETYRFPGGSGFSGDKAEILRHINAIGVGAEVSIIAIPTYAFLTGIGVHVEAEEEGLVFELVTRNGLALPESSYLVVTTADEDNPCGYTRTLTYTAPVPDVDGGGEDPVVVGDAPSLTITGIGALSAGQLARDYFYRSAYGKFSLEADEIIMRVTAMPASGVVLGNFDISVTAAYDVIHRAER